MGEPSSYEPESHRIRAALAPVVARVLRRHGREPVKLAEPANASAPWFSLKDDAGAPLVLVAAHDHHVHCLLGRRGFVASRHWVEAEIDALAHWFEDVLDAALGGGLEVHAGGTTATLRTRSGAIPLSA
jgi:hypothetical protein